ncbi:MAG: hypothetical protein NTW42_07420 [Deltaproteobacteria bacterium]|nr:hypothetical protein [Deltaproteobacteria bacterium]
MKKILTSVAALGLLAGLAPPSLAVEFTISGKYLLEGAYLSGARGNGLDLTEAAGENSPSDAYFLHTFEIKPVMKVTDKISMFSTIRLADDTFWGNQPGGDTNDQGTNNDVYVHLLYMDYDSPVGKMRLGRGPVNQYGTNFMDFDSRADQVTWWPGFVEKPWSALLYTLKNTDNFQVTPNASDTDFNVYVARLYYTTDSLDSGIHYGYYNNMTTSTKADRKQAVIVYGKYKMENCFVNGELSHFFGSVKQDVETGLKNRDYDSWAGMLQVGGRFNALTPSLMYFYASGQDRNATAANGGDIENALGGNGTGDRFEPLYILTGRHTGMLNNDIFSGQTTAMSRDGVHALVLAADYAASNRLTLHGAVAWGKADKVNIANKDDEYGREYNLGSAYKLLDNLTYEAHFGYLDTGDYFKSETNLNDSQTENVYILTHSLTMTF